MAQTAYLDISEILEAFDPEDVRVMIQDQLAHLDDDSCEIMTDNFKNFYVKYASLTQQRSEIGPDMYQEAQDRFFQICDIFIEEISKKLGFMVDQDYLNDHMDSIPAMTLPIYLFFVLDLRSNVTNVLLSFIYKNSEAIWETFKDRLQKHDSVTAVNRAVVADQTMALIASNAYDIVDWCMEQMTAELYMENCEAGYVALEPIQGMIDQSAISGMDAFVDSLKDILHENIALKARICFDIICRIKGYKFDQ